MMQTAEMLKVFARHRGDAIVIPGRGGRHWVGLSDKPNRDLPMGDPAMGGHAMFGLGVALARPQNRVVLFDSEGDLQMSMGVLATIADQAPKNFYHFLLDNECYATTGGQPVPNAKNVQYDQLARASGYQRTYAFTNLEEFTGAIGDIMNGPGPVFVALKVQPEIINEAIGRRPRWQTRSRTQVIDDLQKELGIAS
jgi:thiamine pyrophosphate-dependent acetolactate synthase large subunit-like protein